MILLMRHHSRHSADGDEGKDKSSDKSTVHANGECEHLGEYCADKQVGVELMPVAHCGRKCQFAVSGAQRQRVVH